jgi:nitrate/TMAO reductase-like tetraheme cytochrome c subunit
MRPESEKILRIERKLLFGVGAFLVIVDVIGRIFFHDNFDNAMIFAIFCFSCHSGISAALKLEQGLDPREFKNVTFSEKMAWILVICGIIIAILIQTKYR